MEREASLILEALKQAIADPSEQRLFRSGKLPGLFPSRGGVGGEAAARALREGLLTVTRTETRGRTTCEWVRPTPRGIDYLYDHESPVMALHALRAALAVNRAGVPEWLDQVRFALTLLEQRFVAEARSWQLRLEGLERRLDDALKRIEESQPLLPTDLATAYPWAMDALNYLERRAGGGVNGICPLPELFSGLARVHPDLSIHAFHEGLRRLNDRRVLRLEPAADLAQLTHPEFALPAGGQVYYFAVR
jgi:hypothetical protein